MFLKVILTSLAIGALSVNALNVPIAREPAPEPDFQDVEARGFWDIGKRPVSIYGDPADKYKHKDKHNKPNHKREPGGGKASGSSPSSNKASGSHPASENHATKAKPSSGKSTKGKASGK